MRPIHTALCLAAVCLLFVTGCNLPRMGEGDYECFGAPSYSINSERHSYHGSGACGGGPYTGHQKRTYELSAVWDVASKRFSEIFRVEGGYEYISQSICNDDPILNGTTPCLCTAISGPDPKIFFTATGLKITPLLDAIPLSRAVVGYAWSDAEYQAMQQLAQNPPPPSPNNEISCGMGAGSILGIPPKIFLPNSYFPGLSSDPDNVSLMVMVNCRVPKSGYQGSTTYYGIQYTWEKQVWDNGTNGNIWVPGTYVDGSEEMWVPFNDELTGPAVGFASTKISLPGTARYRIKAQNVVIWSAGSLQPLSEYGNWVEFNAGRTLELSSGADIAGELTEQERFTEKFVDKILHFKPDTLAELHRERFAHLSDSAHIATSNLRVEFQAVESDNPAHAGRYKLAFMVSNQGIKTSKPTKLAVNCERVGGGPCGFWFDGNYDVNELSPPPNNNSQVFATEGWVMKPPPGVRFKLTGTVAEGIVGPKSQVTGYFPPLLPHELGLVGAIGNEMPGAEQHLHGSLQQPALKRQLKEGGQMASGAIQSEGAAADIKGLKGKLVASGAAAKMAKLAVRRIWTVPARPIAGEPFTLHISMANQGKGEGGLGDVCQVNCVSLGTGQCPVLTGQPRLSQAIAVGGIQTLKLDNLRYPVGEYRLTVTPSSAPEGMLAQKLSVLPQPHIAPAMGAAAGQLGQSTGVENSNLPGSARRALKHP